MVAFKRLLVLVLQRAKLRTGKDLLDFMVDKLLGGREPVVDEDTVQ